VKNSLDKLVRYWKSDGFTVHSNQTNRVKKNLSGSKIAFERHEYLQEHLYKLGKFRLSAFFCTRHRSKDSIQFISKPPISPSTGKVPTRSNLPTMKAQISSAILLGSALFGNTLAFQPPISPAYDIDGVLETDLETDLPQHSSTRTAWTAGWIPSGCYNEAVNHNLSPSDFEVYDVKYTDCSAPWTICRHKNAPYSWDTIAKVSQHTFY
jgi:hypothetical protein